MAKEQVHTIEENKMRAVEAYETQIRSLTETLNSSRQEITALNTALTTSEERVKSLEVEVGVAQGELKEVQSELEEKEDRVRAMEEDAGAEFRSRIRMLERKVADGTAKVSGTCTVHVPYCFNRT